MSDILDDLFQNIDIEEPSEQLSSNEVEPSSNESSETSETPEVEDQSVEQSEQTKLDEEGIPPKDKLFSDTTPSNTVDVEKEVERIIERRNQEELKRQEYQKKAKEEEEEALKNIPDPILDIEGWKKYQLTREARIQSNMENKFRAEQEQIRNTQALTDLSNKIESSRESATKLYSSDVVVKAEKWAADLISKNPEYLSYLVENPSLEYVTKEYIKLQDKLEFENNPSAFIQRKYQELLKEEVKEPGNQVVNQQGNQPTKKPPTSINKISSSNISEPEVPEFLQGLF